MKNKTSLIVIISSIILNLILSYFLFFNTEKVNRIPPWHPFKLNSNLTLKSIVKDGYRFDSSPCGQVQYIKQIADTVIQYQVGIDCFDYKGVYEHSMILGIEEDEDLESSKTKIISQEKPKTREEMIAENKYYPWNIETTKNCYQKIDWRVFYFSLGAKIDSLFIKKYIENKGGNIVRSTERWNSKEGGSFMVYNPENNLYFLCDLTNNKTDSLDSYDFSITRYIPNLDQKLTAKDKEQQIKRDTYYGK